MTYPDDDDCSESDYTEEEVQEDVNPLAILTEEPEEELLNNTEVD